MSEWQDISTAPKDGTHILCYSKENRDAPIYVVKWDEHSFFHNEIGWKEASGENYFLWAPTHWMKLPEYPEENMDKSTSKFVFTNEFGWTKQTGGLGHLP